MFVALCGPRRLPGEAGVLVGFRLWDRYSRLVSRMGQVFLLGFQDGHIFLLGFQDGTDILLRP
jgi:hypothetical protein